MYVSPFPAKALDFGLDQFGKPGDYAIRHAPLDCPQPERAARTVQLEHA
jgi:hypothetical protein